MTGDPDKMQADIQQTLASLSHDVGALTQAASPRNVARRQRNRLSAKMSGAKRTIMGTASHAQSVSGDAMSSASGMVSSAPQAARENTQGNPLAAGLVALGLGWLAGSIIPAAAVERQATATLKEKAAPLAQEVSEIAKESAQNLQQPAKEAVEQVKSTGADAVQAVKEESRSTASDMAETAKEGAQDIKQSQSR